MDVCLRDRFLGDYDHAMAQLEWAWVGHVALLEARIRPRRMVDVHRKRSRPEGERCVLIVAVDEGLRSWDLQCKHAAAAIMGESRPSVRDEV